MKRDHSDGLMCGHPAGSSRRGVLSGLGGSLLALLPLGLGLNVAADKKKKKKNKGKKKSTCGRIRCPSDKPICCADYGRCCPTGLPLCCPYGCCHENLVCSNDPARICANIYVA